MCVSTFGSPSLAYFERSRLRIKFADCCKMSKVRIGRSEYKLPPSCASNILYPAKLSREVNENFSLQRSTQSFVSRLESTTIVLNLPSTKYTRIMACSENINRSSHNRKKTRKNIKKKRITLGIFRKLEE